MQLITLSKDQIWYCHVDAGSSFYLQSGSVKLLKSPAFIDMTMIAGDVRINGGEIYTMQRSGWVQLQALRSSEIRYLHIARNTVAAQVISWLNLWKEKWRPGQARQTGDIQR